MSGGCGWQEREQLECGSKMSPSASEEVGR